MAWIVYQNAGKQWHEGCYALKLKCDQGGMAGAFAEGYGAWGLLFGDWASEDCVAIFVVGVIGKRVEDLLV